MQTFETSTGNKEIDQKENSKEEESKMEENKKENKRPHEEVKIGETYLTKE